MGHVGGEAVLRMGIDVWEPVKPADRFLYQVQWSDECKMYIGSCSGFPNLRYPAKPRMKRFPPSAMRLRGKTDAMRAAWKFRMCVEYWD